MAPVLPMTLVRRHGAYVCQGEFGAAAAWPCWLVGLAAAGKAVSAGRAGPVDGAREDIGLLAEREGFEPPIPLRVCRISSAVQSTTLPPLRGCLT